ncbi:hypothetical protein FJZ19_05770 [Candidatus Pacearchaeota archaeon]|nr:hypothetical protein [Candidatus Pacearchaeota archaeon]
MNYDCTAELNVYSVGSVLCYSGVGGNSDFDNCAGVSSTPEQLTDNVRDFARRQGKLLIRSAPPGDTGSAAPADKITLRKIRDSLANLVL